jgi:hypothetical protein
LSEVTSTALRNIAAQLIEEEPSLTSRIAWSENEQLVLLSDTNERARDIRLWDEKGDLGLEFGPWHTHGNIASWTRGGEDEIDCLVGIVLAIVNGEIAILDELEGPLGPDATIIDFEEEDALLDVMTQRDAPTRIRIRTWSGEGDREHTLDSL